MCLQPHEWVVWLRTQPPATSLLNLACVLKLASEAQAPSFPLPALLPSVRSPCLSVRVPHGTDLLMGMASPGWALPGRTLICCVPHACRPRGSVLDASWRAESWPGSFWGLGLEPGPSRSCRLAELSPNACQPVKAGVGHSSCRNQAGSKELSLQIKENCFGKKQATNNL